MRRVIGNLGEQAAADKLESDGYEIISRNFRVRGGEIDIVARQGNTIVFCEVKTRTSDAFGPPEEAVTSSKRRRLRRLALEFLQRTGHRAPELRFDVIAVDVNGGGVSGLRHLVDAF